MDLIGCFQPFMCFRSLTSSTSRSSSSSADAADADTPPPKEKYDVFISFRGEDTRKTFTSHLHAALCQKKIETYIDRRLQKGDEVGPALQEAIEKSKLSVVIFSKNYASSTWCLDELAHILVCREKHGQIVVPIFYGVDPTHVRKQTGSCEVAFRQLTKRFKGDKEQVLKWRAALKEASNLAGFPYSSETGTEADFVKKVVEEVWTKLMPESSYNLKGLVAIESHIKQIESLLCRNDSLDVCTVGIWGMGGIGKTTLAEAVFHGLSSKFEGCCLLKNVREKSEKTDGRDHLEKTLFSDILKENGLSIGSILVRKRLSQTKVLIVFDDVSDWRQIEHLAADPLRYGPGSRIIITTRDRGTLPKSVEDDKIYELKGLKFDDALQLFELHAFRKNPLRTNHYTNLSARVVNYARGMPLALKIMGSSFLHCKDWKEQLKKLKKFGNKEIQSALRFSYDALEENEKQIFLDIACFYKGSRMVYVNNMLKIRGFFPATGIEVLVDKSLISIDSWNSTQYSIRMHDLLQEMGQAIVREQCTEEPGKRSRLWDVEDVQRVLKNNTGTATLQCIWFHNYTDIVQLQLPCSSFEKMYNLQILNNYTDTVQLQLPCSSFEKMYNLQILSIKAAVGKEDDNFDLSQGLVSLPNSLRYLCWEDYSFKSLPSKFSPQNLVELRMPRSQLEQLWNEDQNFGNLKVVDLSYSTCLTDVRGLSGCPKIEHIELGRCESLVRIPSNFKDFDKLTHLTLTYCPVIEFFPEMPDNIEILELSDTPLRELSISSVKCLFHIRKIKLSFCDNLLSLPTSICNLKSLKKLDLRCCRRFEYFPEILKPMEHLKHVDLPYTAVKHLPSSIGNLIALQKLNLRGCSELESLPDELICLPSLQDLDLSDSMIESIPASIKQASQLSRLILRNCRRLQSLPELPMLQILDASKCRSLESVSSSRTTLLQSWGKYQLFRAQLRFYNCVKLNHNAVNDIFADVQLRIIRVGTASLKFEEEEKKIIRKTGDTLVSSSFPGNEIPNWFNHQNEGSSMTIKLPPDWFSADFLGFALSLVVAPYSDTYNSYEWLKCKCNIETSNGESHEIYSSRGLVNGYVQGHNVIVLYAAFPLVEEGPNSKCSTAFGKLGTEASFDFTLVALSGRRSQRMQVKRCGIRLLHVQDADEILKLEGTAC